MLRRAAPVSPPVVLTVAGSDSGGGAGIQADLKTIEATGGFGTSAITNVTAQNTRGVRRTHGLPSSEVRAQIDAVLEDFDVAAVKTGMLGSTAVVDLVAEYATDLPNLVVDPVMVAASGDRLLERDAEDAYERLVADATLVTPNADEAAVLTGVDVTDEESARRAGEILVEEQGAQAALVKGGHVPGEVVADVLVTPEGATTITHDRVDTQATHGSGCTLSSAIATELAHGNDLRAAVTAGVALLARAVRYNIAVGDGPGAVHHLVGVRDDAARGDTVAALLAWPETVGTDPLAAIGGPDGVAIVGATPYAEDPADLAVVSVGPGGHETVRIGADGPLGAALLGAREAVPSIRFGLRCRHDDAVADALSTLAGPVVTASGGDGSQSSAVRRTLADATDGVIDPPVTVTLAGAEDPSTVLLAASTERLAEQARTLAAALA